MQTRSRKKVECTPAASEHQKQLELEISEWLQEGSIVKPDFSAPSEEDLRKWNTLITLIYFYPNILAHPDLQFLRDLFTMFQADIKYDNWNVLIPLPKTYITDGYLELQSCMLELEANHRSVSDAFSEINTFEVLEEINSVILRDYSLASELQSIFLEIIYFVATFPEILLYDSYKFLYDFFAHFGVTDEAIANEVVETQVRRSKSQNPGSSLLLKFGIPEDKTSQEGKNELISIESSNSENFVSYSHELTLSTEEIRRIFGFSDTARTDEDYVNKMPLKKKKSVTFILPKEDTPKKRFKKWNCTVCIKKFSSKFACNKHIRTNHAHGKLYESRKYHHRHPKMVLNTGSTVKQYSWHRKYFSKRTRKFHPRNNTKRYTNSNRFDNMHPSIITVPSKYTNVNFNECKRKRGRPRKNILQPKIKPEFTKVKQIKRRQHTRIAQSKRAKYKCPFCGKRYSRIGFCTLHISKMHPENSSKIKQEPKSSTTIKIENHYDLRASKIKQERAWETFPSSYKDTIDKWLPLSKRNPVVVLSRIFVGG